MIGARLLRNCMLTIGCICPMVISAQSGNDEAAANYADAGQQALAAGRYGEAQTNFENLAKLKPGIAEVHATLAVIYFKQRQYDSAVREIHTAQKLKPALPKLDSLLGMSLAEEGQFKEALPGLEKGFKQSSDAEVKRMCGLQLLRAYTGLNRDSDAVMIALALNKLYPDDPEVMYHTGRIYGNIAYVVMEKLHDDAPDSIWMLQAQAEAYESQKDYQAAIPAFEHVLKVDPNRPGIHYRMGRVYLRRFKDSRDMKDRDAAMEQFHAELAVDPQNGNAAYELAQIDYEAGNLDQAQKQFETVLARHPDFEQAQVGLAGVFLENGNAELAAVQLKRAVALNPNDEVAWYRLTHALRLTRDAEGLKQAMAEFKRLHAQSDRLQEKQRVLSDASDITPQELGTGEP